MLKYQWTDPWGGCTTNTLGQKMGFEFCLFGKSSVERLVEQKPFRPNAATATALLHASRSSMKHASMCPQSKTRPVRGHSSLSVESTPEGFRDLPRNQKEAAAAII